MSRWLHKGSQGKRLNCFSHLLWRKGLSEMLCFTWPIELVDCDGNYSVYSEKKGLKWCCERWMKLCTDGSHREAMFYDRTVLHEDCPKGDTIGHTVYSLGWLWWGNQVYLKKMGMGYGVRLQRADESMLRWLRSSHVLWQIFYIEHGWRERVKNSHSHITNRIGEMWSGK